MEDRDPHHIPLPGESPEPGEHAPGADGETASDEGASKSKTSAEAAALAEAFLEQLRRGDAGIGEAPAEAPAESAPVAEEAESGRKKVKKIPAKLVTQLERRIGELEAKLDEVKGENEKNYDARIRLQADFENYRRRSQKDKADAVQYANEELLKEFLPAIDNLERALAAASNHVEGNAVAEGVKITLNQILHTLVKFGVEGFSSLGQPFDPQLHDAMTQVDTSDYPSGHVASEFVKGYRYRDRLLRPAMVAVAKSSGKAEPKTGNVERVALGGPAPGAMREDRPDPDSTDDE